jgi:hypothetical protein
MVRPQLWIPFRHGGVLFFFSSSGYLEMVGDLFGQVWHGGNMPTGSAWRAVAGRCCDGVPGLLDIKRKAMEITITGMY